MWRTSRRRLVGIKMKYKKKYFRRFPLSRFLAETAIINFLQKSFGVDVKLQVPLITYKINARNMSGGRS